MVAVTRKVKSYDNAGREAQSEETRQRILDAGRELIEERGYRPTTVAAMGAEPDPARKLAIYARAVREIQARMAPLLLALRDASATEPDAAEVWREVSDRRAANMRKLAQDLKPAGGLRAGLSIDEAADVIWATNSSELYVLLTVERGWPPNRYERWLSDTWCRLLLPDKHREHQL